MVKTKPKNHSDVKRSMQKLQQTLIGALSPANPAENNEIENNEIINSTNPLAKKVCESRTENTQLNQSVKPLAGIAVADLNATLSSFSQYNVIKNFLSFVDNCICARLFDKIGKNEELWRIINEITKRVNNSSELLCRDTSSWVNTQRHILENILIQAARNSLDEAFKEAKKTLQKLDAKYSRQGDSPTARQNAIKEILGLFKLKYKRINLVLDKNKPPQATLAQYTDILVAACRTLNNILIPPENHKGVSEENKEKNQKDPKRYSFDLSEDEQTSISYNHEVLSKGTNSFRSALKKLKTGIISSINVLFNISNKPSQSVRTDSAWQLRNRGAGFFACVYQANMIPTGDNHGYKSFHVLNEIACDKKTENTCLKRMDCS